MSEVFSVKRAAEELDLRYGQVIRLIRSGRLEARKAEGGWGWMISKASVDELKCKNQG